MRFKEKRQGFLSIDHVYYLWVRHLVSRFGRFRLYTVSKDVLTLWNESGQAAGSEVGAIAEEIDAISSPTHPVDSCDALDHL